MAKSADRYLLIHPWKIIEEGFDPERKRVSESIFSLGNEYQGVRGFFDEGYSGDSLTGCYLNGVYEEHYLREPLSYQGISNRLCFMVNSANWLYTRVELDGEMLDLARCSISDFRQELDLKTGELQRGFVWNTASGKQLKITFSRFLSMPFKELAFQRIRFLPLNFSESLALTLGIDFSILHETFAENFWTCPRKSSNRILGVSKNIGHKLLAGYRVSSPAPAEEKSLQGEQFIGQQHFLILTEGKEITVDKLNFIYTTRDPNESIEKTWTMGTEIFTRMAQAEYDGHLNQNAAHWAGVWARSDITIDGDPAAQQGIRYCIFQLQQTYRGAVEGAGIGAKGLTGEGYNGNTFWDSETYCLPYYLFNNPPAAKQMLDFRYQTLPRAVERAAQLDCEGACFPVATSDGTESCTLWQHASLQFQSTTAVAYAIWHYSRVIGDHDFLYTRGIELLIQICRFLASRGQWAPGSRGFGYYAVMGPDEFHMMVNNNCYTNLMAKKAFEFTLQVLADMGKSCPERKAGLLARVGCAGAELEGWRRMADSMILPRDARSGIYEQHEGFFELPHLDPDSIAVEDFPLYDHWSYDRIYRHDMIKQPDVLMFMFLYNQSFSRSEKESNYDYYAPRCIHESSLSPSVHSILATELGHQREAMEFYRFATRIDLDNYNRNTADGIHTTSIAAAWMNIVYGFGGMRTDGEILSLDPGLPETWNAYCFHILYRGSLLRVEVSKSAARLQVIQGPPVCILIQGQLREISRDGFETPIGKGQPS